METALYNGLITIRIEVNDELLKLVKSCKHLVSKITEEDDRCIKNKGQKSERNV